MIIPLGVLCIVNWYQGKFTQLPVLSPKNEVNISFHLVNQHGKEVSDKDFEEKIMVADFFFTHCPSICAKMTANLKLVQQAVVNDPSVVINSFSIDPERDSVARLAEYASKLEVEGKWNLLTGEKKIIYQLARKRFMVDATEGDGGPNDFIHSDKFVLIDKKGRIRGYYKGTDRAEVQKLINDIAKLRAQGS
jgi:protein SCO1/2